VHRPRIQLNVIALYKYTYEKAICNCESDTHEPGKSLTLYISLHAPVARMAGFVFAHHPQGHFLQNGVKSTNPKSVVKGRIRHDERKMAG
jgi:hypothetical protein